MQEMMGDLNKYEPEEEIGDIFKELLGGMAEEGQGADSGGTLGTLMRQITNPSAPDN